MITLDFFRCFKYCIFVLNERNDSEIIDLGLSETTKLLPLSEFPITPKTGIFVTFVKSDLLMIVSLKKSLILTTDYWNNNTK